MKYATVVTDSVLIVVDTTTGSDVKIHSDSPNFKKAVQLIAEGKYHEVLNMDIRHVVESFFKSSADSTVQVSIKNGVGKIALKKYNMEVPLSDAITKKIIKMAEQKFDCQPLVNFLAKLYKNPSPTAIEELYLFVDNCELPITEDGCFIAYKIVKNDYMDIYSGTIRNKVGDAPEMPRGLVDDKRDNLCSHGLHFCSKNYLAHYGSASKDNDRCMLVKIDPADVVSIPSDYNNAKGRAAKYVVVGEVAQSGWRGTLTSKDYTEKAVVSSTGEDYNIEEELTIDDVVTIVENSHYYYVPRRGWFDNSFSPAIRVGRKEVKNALDLSYTDLDEYESCNDWA